MYQALQRYPVLNIEIKVKSVAGYTTNVEKRAPKSGERQWIKVKKDSEYTLSVVMRRTNPFTQKDGGKAFAPK